MPQNDHVVKAIQRQNGQVGTKNTKAARLNWKANLTCHKG